jgi:hypothetical protein
VPAPGRYSAAGAFTLSPPTIGPRLLERKSDQGISCCPITWQTRSVTDAPGQGATPGQPGSARF